MKRFMSGLKILGGIKTTEKNTMLSFPGRWHSLAVLAEYCLPPLRVGGVFVAMKGPKLQEEIKAAENALVVLGGEIRKVVAVKLPFTGDERELVLIGKIKATPETYPRRAGVPAKNPL